MAKKPVTDPEFINAVNFIQNGPLFHGRMKRKEAEDLLKHHAAGSYIFRINSKGQPVFSAKNAQGKVVHVQVDSLKAAKKIQQSVNAAPYHSKGIALARTLQDKLTSQGMRGDVIAFVDELFPGMGDRIDVKNLKIQKEGDKYSIQITDGYGKGIKDVLTQKDVDFIKGLKVNYNVKPTSEARIEDSLSRFDAKLEKAIHASTHPYHKSVLISLKQDLFNIDHKGFAKRVQSDVKAILGEAIERRGQGKNKSIIETLLEMKFGAKNLKNITPQSIRITYDLKKDAFYIERRTKLTGRVKKAKLSPDELALFHQSKYNLLRPAKTVDEENYAADFNAKFRAQNKVSPKIKDRLNDWFGENNADKLNIKDVSIEYRYEREKICAIWRNPVDRQEHFFELQPNDVNFLVKLDIPKGTREQYQQFKPAEHLKSKIYQAFGAEPAYSQGTLPPAPNQKPHYGLRPTAVTPAHSNVPQSAPTAYGSMPPPPPAVSDNGPNKIAPKKK